MSSEVFEFEGQSYDVEATLAALEAGTLPQRLRMLPIKTLAERRLKGALAGWVNVDYAVKLFPDRLAEPGLYVLLRCPDRRLVIDGNHRLVARWLNGERYMEFYSLKETEVVRVKA